MDSHAIEFVSPICVTIVNVVTFIWHVIAGCPKSKDVDVTAAVEVSKNGKLGSFCFSEAAIEAAKKELRGRLMEELKRPANEIDINVVFVDNTDGKYTVLWVEKGPVCGNQIMLHRTGRGEIGKKVELVRPDVYLKIFRMLVVIFKIIQRTTSWEGGDSKGAFMEAEFSKRLHEIHRNGTLEEMIKFLRSEIDLRRMFDEGIYERNRRGKVVEGEVLSKNAQRRAEKKAAKKAIKEERNPTQKPISKPWPMVDAAKKVAFQLVQTLALLWGWDLSTKEYDIPPLPIFQQLIPVMNRRVDFTDRSETGKQKSMATLELVEGMKQVVCGVVLELISKYPEVGLTKLSAYNPAKGTLTVEEKSMLKEIQMPLVPLPFGISVENFELMKQSPLYAQCKPSEQSFRESYVVPCDKCRRLVRMVTVPLCLNYHHAKCNSCV